MLTQAAGISLHSLDILLDESFMGARDTFGISRSICEASVNASYLLFEPAAAQRATAYSMQRFYRDANRETTLAGLTLSVASTYQVNLDGLEGLQDAIAMFTRPSGAEIREWSGQTIDKKIDILAEHESATGKSLALSRLMIYGVSSEILHGSPYGVLYFWTGIGTRPASGAEARRKMMIHYLTCILASALALDGLISSWKRSRPEIRIKWNSDWITEFLERLVKLQMDEDTQTGTP